MLAFIYKQDRKQQLQVEQHIHHQQGGEEWGEGEEGNWGIWNLVLMVAGLWMSLSKIRLFLNLKPIDSGKNRVSFLLSFSFVIFPVLHSLNPKNPYPAISRSSVLPSKKSKWYSYFLSLIRCKGGSPCQKVSQLLSSHSFTSSGFNALAPPCPNTTTLTPSIWTIPPKNTTELVRIPGANLGSFQAIFLLSLGICIRLYMLLGLQKPGQSKILMLLNFPISKVREVPGTVEVGFFIEVRKLSSVVFPALGQPSSCTLTFSPSTFFLILLTPSALTLPTIQISSKYKEMLYLKGTLFSSFSSFKYYIRVSLTIGLMPTQFRYFLFTTSAFVRRRENCFSLWNSLSRTGLVSVPQMSKMSMRQKQCIGSFLENILVSSCSTLVSVMMLWALLCSSGSWLQCFRQQQRRQYSSFLLYSFVIRLCLSLFKPYIFSSSFSKTSTSVMSSKLSDPGCKIVIPNSSCTSLMA